jgi:hypothetical protein
MAPEQFEDPRAVDRRSDLYALAATLYMVVTGEVPFHAHGFLGTMEKKLNGDLVPPRQLVPDLSERVEAAILAGMSLNPADRPESCLAWVQLLTGTAPAPSAASASPRPEPLPDRVSPAAAERRAATRFACNMEGACRPLGSERRTRWKAKLTDVSALGVGLLLSRRFEPGTILLLDLRGTTAASPRRLLMRVVRVRAQGQLQWLVGCQLATALKPAEMQELQSASAGARVVPFWLAGGRSAPARAGA